MKCRRERHRRPSASPEGDEDFSQHISFNPFNDFHGMDYYP
jgi:hypothetical protein